MSAPTLEPVSFSLWRSDPPAFAQALGASFERHGFAVVRDHGLDQNRIDRALAAAKAFFALPQAQKLRWRVAGASGQRGYTPFGVETAKDATRADLKEFWHVGRELAAGHPLAASMAPNVWPDEPEDFREATSWLYAALDRLGGEILCAVALRLGLPRGHFDPAIHEGNSVLRLLHYPPVTLDGGAIRAGAHEDINAITLLLGAEEAGLQILDKAGCWRPIDPPPGAVVVNIGDMLARLTNDVLPSTTHRVVNPAPERAGVARYSTPFFLHFRSDFLIQTLPGCIAVQGADRYPEPITADAFLRRRLEEIRLA
jgi:isopenicillin N synthase-like dioxygenase